MIVWFYGRRKVNFWFGNRWEVVVVLLIELGSRETGVGSYSKLFKDKIFVFKRVFSRV